MKIRHFATLAAVAAIALTGCAAVGGPPKRDAGGQVEEETEALVTDLKLGDCTGPMTDGIISSSLLVPCADEHYYEVYHAEELPPGSFPSDLQDTVDEACNDTYEPFLGGAADSVEYATFTLTPTRESWESGDRTFTCLVGLEEGGITGSLKGSGALSSDQETPDSPEDESPEE
jgi:hypothetical protein